MIIGYCRVSTLDQNEKSQVEALKKYGCTKIYIDKESGTVDNRPEFLKMKDALRPDDILVVTELSRLGRRLLSVLEFIEILKANKINFVSLRENIDLSSPSGTLVLQVMGAIAEFERSRLLERQRLGINYAKEHGVKFGRPSSDKTKVEQAIKLFNNGGLSMKEISELTGLSKATIYRELKKQRN